MTSNSKLNVTATLDTLLGASKNWEENSRKTSNSTLYSILADCLRFYEDMLADVKARKELNTALTAANITYTSATDLVTKIVRYVFRTEAKRVYVYVRVLKIAHEQKIAPLNFAAWVDKHDGIDAISKTPKDGITPSKRNESDKSFGAALLNQVASATPSLTLPTDYAPNKNATHLFSAALLRKERDGKMSIIYAVDNESLVSSILVYAGRKLRKTAEEDAKKVAKAQLEQKREEITQEAVALVQAESTAVAA